MFLWQLLMWRTNSMNTIAKFTSVIEEDMSQWFNSSFLGRLKGRTPWVQEIQQYFLAPGVSLKSSINFRQILSLGQSIYSFLHVVILLLPELKSYSGLACLQVGREINTAHPPKLRPHNLLQENSIPAEWVNMTKNSSKLQRTDRFQLDGQSDIFHSMYWQVHHVEHVQSSSRGNCLLLRSTSRRMFWTSSWIRCVYTLKVLQVSVGETTVQILLSLNGHQQTSLLK